MPPAPKVTRPQIEAALRKWDGKVAHAAEELGIDKSVLHRKVKALGISLGVIRQEVTFTGVGVTERNPSDVSGQLARIGSRVMEDESVTNAFEAGARILGSGMDRAASVLDGLRDQMGKHDKSQPGRLTPENARRLTALRYEMTPGLKRDLSNSQVLNWIFEAGIDEFERRFREEMRKQSEEEKAG